MDVPTCEPRLLTAEEAAFKLLEEATLQGWRSNGADGLSTVKDGNRVGYRPEHVMAFIESRIRKAA